MVCLLCTKRFPDKSMAGHLLYTPLNPTKRPLSARRLGSSVRDLWSLGMVTAVLDQNGLKCATHGLMPHASSYGVFHSRLAVVAILMSTCIAYPTANANTLVGTPVCAKCTLAGYKKQ